jgi:hypothetical protein
MVESMVRTLAIALLLALAFACEANAAFLVGQASAGGNISVLCENQGSIYVSFPSGGTRQVQLDSGFQAEVPADTPGSYTVQCGTETKVVAVAGPPGSAQGQPAQNDWVTLAAVAIMLAFFLLATILLAWQVIFSRTTFAKYVGNGRARLYLKAGKRLERIEISDPVSMGHAMGGLEFSLPAMAGGTEWSHEYEIKDPERALPASLSASDGKGRVSLLSELWIEEGKSAQAPAAGSAAGKGNRRKKLTRA